MKMAANTKSTTKKSFMLHLTSLLFLVYIQHCSGFTSFYPTNLASLHCFDKYCLPTHCNHASSLIRLQKDRQSQTYDAFRFPRNKLIELNMKNKVTQNIRQGLSDFQYGAAYVHNNYLSLWVKILKTTRFVFFPFLLIFISGFLWFPSLSDTLLIGLKKVLRYISVIYLPYQKVANKLYSNKVIHTQTQRQLWELQSRNFLKINIISPFLEEFLLRFLFFKIWKRISKISKETSKEEKSDVMETKKWFGVSRWMIISSVIFSALHIGNYVPFRSGHENKVIISNLQNEFSSFFKEEKELLPPLMNFFTFCYTHEEVMKTLFSLSVTFTISLAAFCPIYQSRGFVGAFGAHVMWNTFAPFYMANLFWRMLNVLAN